jgi:alpha-beta hydrolase superfamily lysophospholipase
MKYEMIEFKTSDGNVNFFHMWTPESSPEIVVVLSHGMTEHGMRYRNFAEFLCENGIAFFAEDHRGHGLTGKKAEENGSGKMSFLAEKDGFNRVTEDIYEEVLFAKEKFPGAKIVLFGHSFGSFIAQNFIEKYGGILDRAILCGTAGPRKITVFLAELLGGMVKFFCGKKSTSIFLNFAAFGSCNSRIKNPRTKSDWLTRNEKIVDEYEADPLCGIPATTGFMCDIFSGLNQIHADKNISRIPPALPIFLIAGNADPVGSYGKTVQKLYEIYRRKNFNACIKIYDGCRHELLNELNRDEIFSDILHFIKS